LRALIVIATIFLAGLPNAWFGAAGCSADEATTGQCNVSGHLDDDEAILDGHHNIPGHDPRPGNTDDDEDSLPAGSPSAPANPAVPCTGPAADLCWITSPGDPNIGGGPITLDDIAAFRPDPAVDHMEPNGWTIALLDTNFYATGGAHTKAGTLLGQAASVRFTPVRWHWAYGDGTEASHPFPGGTWAAQGIPEFDPTGTSHIYRQYGTYYIDLDVEYEAEYRFGGGPWVDIDGTLTVPANQLVITAGDAKTVLVQRECTKNPRGPGC